MSAHLMYHPVGAASAQLLAEALGIPCSTDGPEDRVDYLIRYGTLATTRFRSNIRTINTRGSLCRRGKRHEMLRTMDSVNIPVPPFTTSPDSLPSKDGLTTTPILIRNYPTEDIQPHRGAGIDIIGPGTSLRLIPPADLYMHLLPKAKQYRVHVVCGRIRTHELVPTTPEAIDLPIWNDDGPFEFRNIDPTPPLRTIGAAAVACFGLDFGAVDIILTQDGFLHVLEINTAPGLTGMTPTLDFYASTLAPFTRS